MIRGEDNGVASEQSVTDKAAEQIHGIFDEHLAHLPAAERKKKWSDLERYLNAVAPGALPERSPTKF